MEIIFLLVPLSLVLVGGIVWAFFWAVRSGQFDDLEGPAHRILMDDDDAPSKQAEVEENGEKAGKTGDKVKSEK
jgi:cbb3-type cytochrome oxidase maturation protein